MKYLLALSLLMVGTIVYAQTVAPTELTLKVTPPEADMIWKGLRELPVKDVEALMGKIRQQVAEQTTPKPEAKSVEPPKDKK